MSKTLIEVRPDGLALAVKVDGGRIQAEVKKARARPQEIGGFVLELGEPIFARQFNIAGMPRPLVAHELFVDWIREKIPSAEFKHFAGPIARLAQQITAPEIRSAA